MPRRESVRTRAIVSSRVEPTSAHAQDPSKRHELDRTSVRELVCALCTLRQPVAAACSGCGVAFGAYACLTCCFFDDDLKVPVLVPMTCPFSLAGVPDTSACRCNA